MDKTMIIFAWIVIAGSFFAAGWYAKELWDFIQLIDESCYEDRSKTRRD